MIEKGKISALQMGILMYLTILATAILIAPSITGKYAKHDMWLSPIIGSVAGFLSVFIAYRLHKLYPDQTIIQYSGHILGRIPGKIIGLLYLIFYLQINGIVIREYAEFIVGTFLTLTPISVFIGSMLVLCAFAVRGGVEVIGRLGQLFIPVFVFPLLMIMLLLFPDLKVSYMFPVMEHGIFPAVLGSVAPQAWFSEFFLISFLLPYLTDREKGMKWGMISVFAVMLTLVAIDFTVLFFMSTDTAISVYPFMDASMYVSIAEFFEHLESVIMMVWVTGAFIKIGVIYYALALGTAQWLNLSDYRPVVLPLGVHLMLNSFWALPSFMELAHLLDKTHPFYLIAVQIVIPLLLLLIALIRRKKGVQTA